MPTALVDLGPLFRGQLLCIPGQTPTLKYAPHRAFGFADDKHHFLGTQRGKQVIHDGRQSGLFDQVPTEISPVVPNE